MKCYVCSNELLPREKVQAVTLPFGGKAWPKSLCDDCAKAHQTKAGTLDALERLHEGKLDPEEVERVAKATPIAFGPATP